MDFGDKLKQYRLKEGLSQEQLAEKIGVSRQAITKWETKRGLPDIENVIIVLDDIDTNPGHIRIRKSGSAGSHNGLKSIIAETGTTEFKRLRIGIGKQAEHQDLANFVLSRIKMTDEQKNGLDKALEALYDYVMGHEIDNIMSKYNG